jgi:hypothetical protein
VLTSTNVLRTHANKEQLARTFQEDTSVTVKRDTTMTTSRGALISMNVYITLVNREQDV